MSIENYKRMKEIGVTGDGCGNCTVAAWDVVSPKHDLPPKTYTDYTAALRHQQKAGINTKFARGVIKSMLDHLGGSANARISERRVRTPDECEIVLNNAREGGRRVIVVCTESRNDVGLVPSATESWIFAGNNVPVYPGTTDPIGPVTSRQVFPHLAQPPRFKRRKRGKSFVQPNIITLDP